MSKPKKPFPDQRSPFVVCLDYGYGHWVVSEGAQTLEAAMKKLAKYKQYGSRQKVVIENYPGTIVPKCSNEG